MWFYWKEGGGEAELVTPLWLSTPGLKAEPTRARVPHHALQSNKYCSTLKPCDCGANTSLCLDTPDRNYTNATADHPKLQSPTWNKPWLRVRSEQAAGQSVQSLGAKRVASSPGAASSLCEFHSQTLKKERSVLFPSRQRHLWDHFIQLCFSRH